MSVILYITLIIWFTPAANRKHLCKRILHSNGYPRDKPQNIKEHILRLVCSLSSKMENCSKKRASSFISLILKATTIPKNNYSRGVQRSQKSDWFIIVHVIMMKNPNRK